MSDLQNAELNNKPFTPEEFKQIFSKVPRLCVDLVVKMDNGIVLTLRGLPTWHKQWHTPGGTVFYKERIEDAVSRVALDELGISVKIIKVLGYIEYSSEEQERGYGWAVSITILCEAVSKNLKINDEALDVAVFKDLPSNMVREQQIFLSANWQAIL